MSKLREFYEEVLSAKGALKGAYYTTRDPGAKDKARLLVRSVITVQKIVEELMALKKKSKPARSVIEDQKATLILERWMKGLPKRIDDFKNKRKSIERKHLSRYSTSLMKYIDKIAEELTGWVLDIETLAELPKPPEE